MFSMKSGKKRLGKMPFHRKYEEGGAGEEQQAGVGLGDPLRVSSLSAIPSTTTITSGRRRGKRFWISAVTIGLIITSLAVFSLSCNESTKKTSTSNNNGTEKTSTTAQVEYYGDKGLGTLTKSGYLTWVKVLPPNGKETITEKDPMYSSPVSVGTVTTSYVYPSLSRSGTKIICEKVSSKDSGSGTPQQSKSLVIFDQKGNLLKEIPNDPTSYQHGELVWAPNDGMVAFVNPTAGSPANGLWVVDTTTGSLQQLDVDGSGPFAWSPNSEEIVEVAYPEGSQVNPSLVRIVSVKTKEKRDLNVPWQYQASNHVLAWVPGENKILVSSYDKGKYPNVLTNPPQSVYSLDPVTQEMKPVSERFELKNQAGVSSYALFSEDGKTLVIVGVQDTQPSPTPQSGGQQYDKLLVGLDGSNPAFVQDGGHVSTKAQFDSLKKNKKFDLFDSVGSIYILSGDTYTQYRGTLDESGS